jgi:hypothetical protein
VVIGSAMARQSTTKRGVHLKKDSEDFPILVPIPNITPFPSSPATRESISVVIPFNHPRKKGVMMQKVNVSHGNGKDGQDGEKERVTPRSSVKINV